MEHKGRSLQFCDGILGCKISIVVSWKCLNDASTFYKTCSLETAEASIIGKIKIIADNKVEIYVHTFESLEQARRPVLEQAETIIPIFLLRGPNTSLLSEESFYRRIKTLWNGISYQTDSPFRFSDFIFIWSAIGFNFETSDKLEITWVAFSAIALNISPGLQKIKNYPFESDCFLHCVHTSVTGSKFQQFQLLKSNGKFQNFRFGFFIMDPSGSLVPYLDGERIINIIPPAGIWCSGALDEEQSSATPLTSFHTWISMLRYAFGPKSQRVFCTSPVLAVHNAASNTVSFYSIHDDNSKSPRSPCLQFESSTSATYGYASRLQFHMFTGFEDLKSRPSRISSQRVVIHLSHISPVKLPNEAVLVDYNKMVEAIATLSADLECQVLRGPLPVLRNTSISRKLSSTQPKNNDRPVKRSVKFRLPSCKDVTSPSPPPQTPSGVTGFEVPEASMLLEEGVPTVSAPAYSPYRYFPSPTPPPPPQPQSCYPRMPACCCYLQTNNNNNHNPNTSIATYAKISRLESLVTRLLAVQQLHQAPAARTPEKTTYKATVGTNTPVSYGACSVAVNTSAVWPTPADIGLVPPLSLPSASPTSLHSTPLKTMESVGIQCESVQYGLTQPKGAYPYPEENDQLNGFPSFQHRSHSSRSPNLQQSLESDLSLDAGLCNGPPSTLPPSHQAATDATNTGDTGYSRLLAGIHQVLKSVPHMRRTVSVPNELSLMTSSVILPRSSATAGVVGTEGTSLTDADAEADVARHRRRCEEEVAERFDLLHSLLPPHSDMPSCFGPEMSTPQPGKADASFPTAPNSFTTAPDLPPQPITSSLPQVHGYHNTRSTDESSILMGLARKYLPPSVIAQLAPSTSSVTTAMPDVSCCGTEFSLATQRYLIKHGLLAANGCENVPVAGGEWTRQRGLQSTEISDIPRLTVMEGSDLMGTRESYFPCSRVFPTTDEKDREVEEDEGDDVNFNAPILNLEHLRALPKLL